MPLHDLFVQRLRETLERQRPDGYDLWISQAADMTIESEDLEVDTFKEARTAGAALRVVKEGRVGFSYATTLDPDPDAIARLAANALDAARVMDPEPLFSLAAPAGTMAKLNEFDPTLEQRPRSQKIETAITLEKAARTLDPRMRTVRSATYRENIEHLRYIASTGLDCEHRATYCSLNLTAVAGEGDASEMGWDMDFAPFFERLNPWLTGEGAARRALALLGAQPGPTMQAPVIFDNAVAAEFLGVLASAVMYENVFKRKSGLIGKKGQRIAAECLNVVDDGLRAGGVSACPFDGEGVPSRTTPVISDGVLTTYLYDLLNAKRDPEQKGVSTSNANRGGLMTPPSPGTRDFYIRPGNHKVEDLVGGMDRGVIVTEVMGMHTANPITGEFSVGAAGHLVEGGKRRHAIRNFAIAGNIFEILQNIEAVGDDLRFFGGTGAPSLLIKKLSIAGS